MAHLLPGYCCNLLACTVFHLYWKPIKGELNVVFLPFHIRHAGVREKKVTHISFMFVVVASGTTSPNVRDTRRTPVSYENDTPLLLM